MPTLHLPLNRLTYLICANLVGMSGVTSMKTQSSFHTNARGEGNEMAQWVLNSNGNVVPRRTVQPLTVDERHSPTEQRKRETFDVLIQRRWGNSINPPKIQDEPVAEKYEDGDEEPIMIPEIEDTLDANGKLIDQLPAYDLLLNAKVWLQAGDEYVTGKVSKRALGPNRKVSGRYHNNPFLNSMLYEVKFPDGQVKEYSANLIAENMLKTC